jgi:hypothetical protein
MELSTIEHVLLARAALATGNPDALEALVRAGLSGNAAVRDRARAVLLAEASARGVTPGGPEDAPATFDDYRARVVRLAADDGAAAADDRLPRWLVAAARLARRTGALPGVATGAERERS